MSLKSSGFTIKYFYTLFYYTSNFLLINTKCQLERNIILTKLIRLFSKSYSGDLLIIPNKYSK